MGEFKQSIHLRQPDYLKSQYYENSMVAYWHVKQELSEIKSPVARSGSIRMLLQEEKNRGLAIHKTKAPRTHEIQIQIHPTALPTKLPVFGRQAVWAGEAVG